MAFKAEDISRVSSYVIEPVAAAVVGDSIDKHPDNVVHRGLRPRHVQLIAISGAIGAAIFISIGKYICIRVLTKRRSPGFWRSPGPSDRVSAMVFRNLGKRFLWRVLTNSASAIVSSRWSRFYPCLGGICITRDGF